MGILTRNAIKLEYSHHHDWVLFWGDGMGLLEEGDPIDNLLNNI